VDGEGGFLFKFELDDKLCLSWRVPTTMCCFDSTICDRRTSNPPSLLRPCFLPLVLLIPSFLPSYLAAFPIVKVHNVLFDTYVFDFLLSLSVPSSDSLFVVCTRSVISSHHKDTMAEDDGFPFGFGGDDYGGDESVSGNEASEAATSIASGTGPLLHLTGSVAYQASDERNRCLYGFCRKIFSDRSALEWHQAKLGHYVCMECAKPRTSRLARPNGGDAAASSPSTATTDKLTATRTFQSRRLLDLHLASMHGIGTAVSTSQRGSNGWSLNDLCDDLLLRMLSYLDLVNEPNSQRQID
jgi:hypothetical protein